MPTWITAALGALQAFFGFGEKVVVEVHDHNQRVAGANTVIAADNKESADANAKVLKVANNCDTAAVDDSLQRGKF